MSSRFDWSQFETINGPSQREGFDWNQFEAIEQPKQGLSIPKIGFGKKVVGESKVPEMAREVGRTGKVIGSTIAGMPGDIVASIGEGLNFLAKNVPGGSPKTEEELKGLTESPFTSKKISKSIEKFVPSLAPKTSEEKEWEDNLSLITSLVTPTPMGKAKAIDPRNASRVYKAAKALGLSERELTPLIQGEKKVGFLGKLAKKTKSLKETLKMTEGKLSDVYTNIKDQAAKLPKLSGQESSDLIDKFEKIRFGLEKTLHPSPDKKAAINFIEAAIEKANNFGTSPEELLNFYQDVNSAVNWNAIRGGKKVLAQLKEPIMKILSDVHPNLARDFENTNALWSKLKSFERKVGIPRIEKYIDYGEVPAFLAALAFGNTASLAKVGAGVAGRRIAAKMLSDPKWQNIHNRILNSIKNTSPKTSTNILQQIKKQTENEMPEEFEKIEWPS